MKVCGERRIGVLSTRNKWLSERHHILAAWHQHVRLTNQPCHSAHLPLPEPASTSPSSTASRPSGMEPAEAVSVQMATRCRSSAAAGTVSYAASGAGSQGCGGGGAK